MNPDAGPRVGSSRIGGLDTLRGLAALAVFVCHGAAYWSKLNLPHSLVALTQVGAHGVDVFVVLSGFVLMLPLVGAGRALNVNQFYGRRFFRILPAYWVALAFAALLAAGPSWRFVVARPATPYDVVVHVFGLQTVLVPVMSSINGSLWSVSLELSLYLIFPAAVIALQRFGGPVVAIGSVVLAAVWASLGAVLRVEGPFRGFVGDPHTLPIRLMQFAIGMALAPILAARVGQPVGRGRRMAALLSASAGVVLATIGSTLEIAMVPGLLLWGLAGGALVWCFAEYGYSSLLRAADHAGARAFSFYLVHQPLLLILAPLVYMLPGPGPVVLVYGGVGALLVVSVAAEALYRFVERPSHQWSRRRFPTPVRTQEQATEPHFA